MNLLNGNHFWQALFGGAALSGLAASLFKTYIDNALKRRSDEQIELLRGSLATQLESAKHSLQLDQARLTFVYEHQKESFSKVIRSMYRSINAIEDKFDYGGEEWRAVDDAVLESFRRVRASESLYTGDEGDRALRVFAEVLSECVFDRLVHQAPDSHLIRDCRDQLVFISSRMAEYFRMRLGTSSKGSLPASEALRDIFRLSAVLLLNRYHFYDAQFPTNGIFRKQENQSPEEIADLCRRHGSALVDELERLEQRLATEKTASFFYTVKDEARTLRKLLKND